MTPELQLVGVAMKIVYRRHRAPPNSRLADDRTSLLQQTQLEVDRK